ncbi:putative DNA modification/repair radical SAM protein [Vallitalea sp.]|jgi:putative DNA modification/repair radical SAM protein|uniref:putative DNA modification/repair radical SAM protein n=1 Tax=Vallitalea sp. TaxID=1882829 RepID=UPI0025DFFCA3|nr:putative DNA modification/repair radical SAM protein [Vallitalea sp.]MCT4687649.1 putative DNA modification/repair radical SAM protein [Vallitalea sp.]
MKKNIIEKLQVLADAAKYDVSCASSGVNRKNTGKIGSSQASGICHTWASDGRCVSLLKILLSNYCVYDCEYCVNRLSNDVKRASFTPEEVAELTIEFYRRNYIEGLFLSSAVEKNPNHTMEKIVKTLLILRNHYGFSGYIHVKAIPGADKILIQQAGELADRMSVNIELPTEDGLKLLAPQKTMKKLFLPMNQIKDEINKSSYEASRYKHAKKFVPAGQSTQMIVGATSESDLSMLSITNQLYKRFNLKRVYFSAYVPVNKGGNLPAISSTTTPMLREHRLYQADWLLRFYKFEAKELLDNSNPNFDLDYDPKMIWALRNIGEFPKEVNKVSVNELLRIPGIGMVSARRILKQRKVRIVTYEDLKKMGVVLKRARFFVTCNGKYYGEKNLDPETIKSILNPLPPYEQLTLKI